MTTNAWQSATTCCSSNVKTNAENVKISLNVVHVGEWETEKSTVAAKVGPGLERADAPVTLVSCTRGEKAWMHVLHRSLLVIAPKSGSLCAAPMVSRTTTSVWRDVTMSLT